MTNIFCVSGNLNYRHKSYREATYFLSLSLLIPLSPLITIYAIEHPVVLCSNRFGKEWHTCVRSDLKIKCIKSSRYMYPKKLKKMFRPDSRSKIATFSNLD